MDILKSIGRVVRYIVPIIIGILIKFSVIDVVPTDQAWSFFKEEYANPLWVELAVIVLILPIGAEIPENSKKIYKDLLLIGPWVLILVCLLLVLGLPKIGVDQEFITIWLPAILGLIFLAITQEIVHLKEQSK